jgi:hypothetical protein
MDLPAIDLNSLVATSLWASGMWNMPLIGSGFIATWMLWWSLAGLIPIALHFWFQRQRREMNWAAMQFLMAAIQKQSRRIRLQQLILLLLRIAILVTLALAAAQPFLSSREPNWIGTTRPPLLWVGVIDTSYSMQYVDSTRQSRWEQAVTKAREMIEQLQPGDGALLLTLGSPPRVIFSEATFDRTTALLELAKLTPTAEGSDLSTTLAVLEDLLDSNRRSHPELTSHHVVFFTDAAGETWNTAPPSSLESTLQSVTKGAELFIERVGDGKSDNTAITDMRIDLARPQQDKEVAFIAEVANLSADTEVETSVQLWLDNQAIQSETVQLTPRERKQVRFQQRFSESKLYRLEARITTDGLTLDDRRHLLMATRADARILLLEDLPGQAKYLDLALSNPITATDKWNATTEVFQVADWRDLNLQNIDLVILCNVSTLPEQLPNLLRDYVQRGGKLLGFLGDRADPASYQRFAELDSNNDAKQNFFPLQLTAPSPLAVYSIDPRNYESPFLRIFQDFPDSGLLTTPIFRYWKLDSSQSLPNSIHIDLATSDHDPVLLTYAYGNGSVAWWLTSPTPQAATIGDAEPWNAMAAWPSFLPLIREQVSYLTRPGENQTQRLVNVPLQGYLPPEITDEQVNVLRPDRRVDPIRPLPPQQDGYRPWVYSGDDQPGFYEVQTTQPLPNQTGVFAVNVDTRESDLTSDGAQKFQTWFNPANLDPSAPTKSVDMADTEPTQTNTDSISSLNRKPIFHWFLGALFGLLLTESLVAFWLGRSRV